MSTGVYKKTKSTWAIYLWPLIINCLCLVGVLAALIGNNWWDIVSWMILGGTSVGLIMTIISSLDLTPTIIPVRFSSPFKSLALWNR